MRVSVCVCLCVYMCVYVFVCERESARTCAWAVAGVMCEPGGASAFVGSLNGMYAFAFWSFVCWLSRWDWRHFHSDRWDRLRRRRNVPRKVSLDLYHEWGNWYVQILLKHLVRSTLSCTVERLFTQLAKYTRARAHVHAQTQHTQRQTVSKASIRS